MPEVLRLKRPSAFPPLPSNPKETMDDFSNPMASPALPPPKLFGRTPRTVLGQLLGPAESARRHRRSFLRESRGSLRAGGGPEISGPGSNFG